MAAPTFLPFTLIGISMKTPFLRTSVVATLLCGTLLAGCAASPAHESTGQYLDDATVTAKVKTELLAKEGTGAANISVETRKGEVQLGGFASTQQEKQRAAEIARSVAGVKEVHNDILVR
jgi:hyperosmotically inducible protein